MKGIVIYHSKYGNCKQVAEAILAGLKESGADVTLAEVSSLDALPEDVDFVVMGSPTRAGRASGPIRKFMKKASWTAGMKFAAFGTGLTKGVAKGDKISAEDISESLKVFGLGEVVPPFRAGVGGRKGPLEDGALDKAKAFGNTVAGALG